jgi:hypothetical protein
MVQGMLLGLIQIGQAALPHTIQLYGSQLAQPCGVSTLVFLRNLRLVADGFQTQSVPEAQDVASGGCSLLGNRRGAA